MSLNDALERVRQFHRHIGVPVAPRPCLLKGNPLIAAKFATHLLELSLVASNQGAENQDQLLTRLGMLLEEISEWLFAHARGDLAAAADAWADHLYVLLGDAVAAGLPAESLFAEVHASNMTKEPNQTSWPGKGVKGPGYRPPDIRSVLENHQLNDQAEKVGWVSGLHR